MHDSRSRLQERAERLLKKEAHVEYPHSTTIRNYHNILIDDESDPSIIKVACNFTTHRTKREMLDTFIGRAYFDLVQTKEGIRIQNKKVILYLDSLRPHGKISLIL
ncbi:aromatic-ring-hydroxylating dioxygenase subunit beta [Geomicrobium sp. JCM 19037]|uniref:aromatic-ring-hydroxylating dioxygenase subunit beta n=1 Tax=Geomicrobium sp. JCM 19037 TaxID=1460634 RepID=UPI0027D779C0|nr:aromatic-ring-hydroxylating dioxygenase subunit beta [Geomicrobium sp. JCM 19037]